MNTPTPSMSTPAVLAGPGLRIAVVTETYPPEVNGVAMTLSRVVEGLLARQHRVQLIRPRQGGAAPAAPVGLSEVLVRGCPIPGYAHLRMGLPAQSHLLKLWRERRPDVVHIATEGPLGWSALQAALRLGLPTTSDFRTNFQAYSKHYGLGVLKRSILAYLRRFHNRAGLTMVPTVALQTELHALGFERLQVVARGVDTQLFSPARRRAALRLQWGVAQDDLVVACVGRLAQEKNLLLLGRAFEAIQARHPRAKLLLVGEGPQRSALQALWPKALFVGQQRGEDLAAHYASADLFLFPSQTETFGNVITEAMASGLPIVAFEHAAAGQLFKAHGCGLLAPLGDEPAFVAASVALAADAAQRRALSVVARLVAESLDWPGVVGQFEAMLQQALGEPTPLSVAAPQWAQA